MKGARRHGARLFAAALLVAAAAAALAPASTAHESRPAYLQLDETAPGRFEVVWRTPVLAGSRLPVVLKLPDAVRDTRPPRIQELTDSRLERRWIDAGSSGLDGRRIEFVGLELTITDVLVRAEMLDGRRWTSLARPSRPFVEFAPSDGPVTVLHVYFVHGLEHILFGYDHLLFVLALILIVRSRRVLVYTITAFTLAHSLTLALATLGVAHVPGPPVEAAIAASILLLATEIVHLRRGRVGLSARWPWLVSFAFGLLHGFGFASALIEVGLPERDVPLALLAFNVGVEAGQLAFVAAVLCAFALAKRSRLGARLGTEASGWAPYAIGSLAAFWMIERVAAF